MTKLGKVIEAHKKWTIFILSALVLIIVLLLYLNITRNTKLNTNDDSSANRSATVNDPAINVANQANKYLQDGDIDGAIGAYVKAAESEDSKADRAAIYKDLAAMLFEHDSVKYKSQIINYAYKAEEASPSPETAAYIANIESSYGNTEVSLKYEGLIEQRAGDNNKPE